MPARLDCIGSSKSIHPKLESLIAFLRQTRERLRTKIAARRLKRWVAADPSPRIVVGSSGICPPDWLPTDVEYLNLLQPRDWQRFFSRHKPVAILAEHVWEHLTPAEGLTAAQTCFNYLQPGGRLRIAVPDGCNPDPTYREWVRPGGSGAGAHDHKVLYTRESLQTMLAEAGFQTQPLEYFDSSGQFHYTDWNPADGMIHRSRRFDERNAGGKLAYTSLIVDARKPVVTGS